MRPDENTNDEINNTYLNAEIGSVRTTTNVPVAIACLTAGLFLGTYFTKRAPVSLIISSS